VDARASETLLTRVSPSAVGLWVTRWAGASCVGISAMDRQRKLNARSRSFSACRNLIGVGTDDGSGDNVSK